MQSPSAPHDREDPCDPEWVGLNHLLSYCAKSMPASVAKPDGTPPDTPSGTRRCNRRACVFGFKKT